MKIYLIVIVMMMLRMIKRDDNVLNVIKTLVSVHANIECVNNCSSLRAT